MAQVWFTKDCWVPRCKPKTGLPQWDHTPCQWPRQRKCSDDDTRVAWSNTQLLEHAEANVQTLAHILNIYSSTHEFQDETPSECPMPLPPWKTPPSIWRVFKGKSSCCKLCSMILIKVDQSTSPPPSLVVHHARLWCQTYVAPLIFTFIFVVVVVVEDGPWYWIQFSYRWCIGKVAPPPFPCTCILNTTAHLIVFTSIR
jgi:hypothetical protein